MKCDIDDVELPESVIKLVYEWLGDETITEENLQDTLQNFFMEKLVECNGKLVDRELAEFLMLVESNTIPEMGGYPKYNEAIFEIEGRKSTAITFFWDTLEKFEDPFIMVYEKTGE